MEGGKVSSTTARETLTGIEMMVKPLFYVRSDPSQMGPDGGIVKLYLQPIEVTAAAIQQSLLQLDADPRVTVSDAVVMEDARHHYVVAHFTVTGSDPVREPYGPILRTIAELIDALEGQPRVS